MSAITLLSGSRFDTETGFDPAPTLIDLAVGQGRQARFCGHTNHWWSVLHHLYAGYFILRKEGTRVSSPKMIAWLMHDAHETITSDIPTPLKTDDMRALQAKIDAHFANIFEIPGVNHLAAGKLHTLDKTLGIAEAYALRPPLDPAKFVAQFGGEPDIEVARVVQAVHSMFSMSASSADGWGSYLVRWWVGRMRGALGLAGGWGDDDGEDLYLVERMLNKNSIIYGDLNDDIES